MREISVNTKNLLYHLLLHWRTIIIVALACAILFDCIGIYKDYKRNIDNQSNPKNEKEIAMSKAQSAQSELTEREIKDVDAAIETYLKYENQYRQLEGYFSDSPLMSFDYRAVPTAILRYRIDDHFMVEYPVIDKKSYENDIAMTYMSQITSDELYSQIADECQIPLQYLREMVVVSIIGGNSNILNFDIIGSDEEQCNKIIEIIKRQMDNLKKKNSVCFPEYDISIIVEKVTVGFNDSVYDKQMKKINDLNTIRINRASILNYMTENQKQYCLAKMECVYLQDENADNNALTNETEKTSHITLLFPKLVAIGLLAGIFLSCFVVVLCYLLNPVVRVKENITFGMGQNFLGTIWLQNDKKRFLAFIDQTIRKWFYGRESKFELDKRIEMICAAIQIAMSKEDVNSLYITGASEKTSEIIKNLEKHIGDDILVKTGESLLYNSQSLKDFSESERVLFVEAAGDSRYDEVQKELEIADQSKVKVLGFVLVQQ